MSGSFSKAIGYFGWGKDADNLPAAPVSPVATARSAVSITRNLASVRSRGNGASISAIQTFQPKSWEESVDIAVAFRDGTPVIVNLADLTASDQRRLVDFMLGLRHGLEGNIKRVTKTVFLLSPGQIEVNDEDEPDVTGMENADDLDIRRPY